MSVYLIRHGLTQGNLEGRYIGCRNDEALCGQGIKRLEELRMPKVRQVFISPMKRCTQTAGILFPGAERIVVPDFRECDFGDFEGKNYTELNGDPAYQAWIDSGGELAFPGGESRKRFAQRCVNAFAKLDLLASDEDCDVLRPRSAGDKGRHCGDYLVHLLLLLVEEDDLDAARGVIPAPRLLGDVPVEGRRDAAGGRGVLSEVRAHLFCSKVEEVVIEGHYLPERTEVALESHDLAFSKSRRESPVEKTPVGTAEAVDGLLDVADDKVFLA